ncbi:hypothetical protein [uncultured Methanobrevibacter sp.]|uniref:hypothetical protein n=1 Tax=uncultured Methanobrevibacter sp. TaxID=253161 RepID=UPI00262BF25C|nr:hypothetical protein [uncultured Methanobrevibacter sp.]
MSIWQDLVEEINSWDNFFIIHDDESADRVCEFSKALGEFHIDHFIIGSDDFQLFKSNSYFGDCILAISGSVEDEFILDLVKEAKPMGFKVYAICRDVCSLAPLADELFDVEGDFTDSLTITLDTIIDEIRDDRRKNIRLKFKKSGAGLIGEDSDNPCYLYVADKTSWLVKCKLERTIFIFADSQFKDIAYALGEKLHSLDVNACVVSDGNQKPFRNLDLDNYNYNIELPSSGKFSVSRADGFVLISKSCSEDYFRDIAKFCDYIICGEKCSGFLEKSIAVGSEDFQKHSLAVIDFLNIELKDKSLSNKVKRLFK